MCQECFPKTRATLKTHRTLGPQRTSRTFGTFGTFGTLGTLLLAALCLLPVPAKAQIRSVIVASGLSQPLALVPDPASGNVFYIVQQGGLVRVIRDGLLQPEPFADLRTIISTGGERGLLGMAFSPDLASSRVFFNYTNVNGDTVISRFRRLPAAPQRIDVSTKLDFRWPTAERVIRQSFSNHNGGHLVFGPDGYLYVGLGDGGSGNDPLNNAQNPGSLLGKMLRLDVGVGGSDPTGYRVPADNPFVDSQPIFALGEIWSFGLRNPWRYSFDDFGVGATGALVLGDVGQGAREEINYEPARAGGRNYGWRMREGFIATPGVPATTPAYGPLTDPIFDYVRAEGRAITGGFVYRGQALGSAYVGRYFFADFETSRVWSLGLSVNPATDEASVTNVIEHTAELGGSLGGVASFGRDLQGELYLLTFAGRVLKIVPAGVSAQEPPLDLRSVVNGSTVTVSWTPPASGTVPTSYQLEAGSVPGAADLGVIGSPGNQTSLTFPGIPPGTYYGRVRSVGAGGVSAPSNEIIIVVGAGGCTGPPPAPTGFASLVNGRNVTLAWSLSSTANGPANFVIEAGSSTDLSNIAVIAIDGGLRSLNVLAPPGQYFVRIRGQNACGTGAVSNEIIVTVF